MISPKLLIGPENKLYAFRGHNQVAYRFGNQIKVCLVEKVFGPFYRRLSTDFFEGIDAYRIPDARS